jgi:hypothetical protein
MTELVEKAFARIAQLPEPEQDDVAAWIMAELESEERWQKAFARSTDLLASLAREATAEYLHKHTQPLDPNKL